MLHEQQSWDVKGHWIAYTPSDKTPWNLRRVVHLHRSAGFAATWKELQRDLADGPRPSITRLLAGRARAEGVSEDFESIADILKQDVREISQLKGWWFFRMYHGPDPLGEGLTLLWHNHFATSNLKLQKQRTMFRKHLIFRKYGRGPFGDGLAGPVILAGPRVKAGLLGEAPSLQDLDEGDLKMTVDFRRVYAGILRDWLKLPSKTALGGDFEPFSLFKD